MKDVKSLQHDKQKSYEGLANGEKRSQARATQMIQKES